MVCETIHIILRGTTMGTTYFIHYLDQESRNVKPEIEQILSDFNQSLSTYIPGSDISIFNRTGRVIFRYPYFYPVLKEAKRIYGKTNGYFNPTLYPLVNKYGFGPLDDVSTIKEKYVLSPEDIEFNEEEVFSEKPVQLDLNAIAKGYAVDVIGEYLEAKNIHNYVVEIGGDIRARGTKANRPWNAGVTLPDSQSDAEESILELSLFNKSLATSGAYRNCLINSDGTVRSHLINPETQDAKINEMLSVTILASNCMTADAYATGVSVAGLRQAMKWHKTLEKERVYMLVFYLNETNSARIYCSKPEYFGFAKKHTWALEERLNSKLENRN